MWDDSIGSWAWPQDPGIGREGTRMDLPGVPTSKGSQVPGKLSGLSGTFKQEGVSGSFDGDFQARAFLHTLCPSNIGCS